jgi:hypothetical protein
MLPERVLLWLGVECALPDQFAERLVARFQGRCTFGAAARWRWSILEQLVQTLPGRQYLVLAEIQLALDDAEDMRGDQRLESQPLIGNGWQQGSLKVLPDGGD